MSFVNNPVWRKLITDCRDITSTLILDFGLKYGQEDLKLNDPLLRWMDFRLRYMPPSPRKFSVAKNFPTNHSADVAAALRHFKELVESGADLNPYQGKGLTLFDDISAKKKKDRTDLMWADWGITHFHLTTAPLMSAAYFSARSEWLLFAIASENVFAAIDIRRHDEPNVFSRVELVTSLVDSWPEMMARFEAKGVLPSTQTLTSAEYAKLRNAGINTFVSVNGKSYLGPGMGLTTAATPLRAQLAIDHIKMHLNDLSQRLLDPRSEYNLGAKSIAVDENSFALKTSCHGIALVDLRLNKAWIPPPAHLDLNNNLTRVSELLLPTWLVSRTTSLDIDLSSFTP